MRSFSIQRLTEFFERPLASLLAWLTIPVLIAFIFGEQLENTYRKPYFLGFGMALFTIVAFIVSLNWRSVRSSIRSKLECPVQMTTGWGLVGVAIGLRYALLDFVPPPLPGFEEMQTGGAAIRIAHGAELPLMFRLTNVLGGLGFTLMDNSLEALRFGFKVAGCLSVLVMALLLRRIGVSWIPTLLAVFTMATLRWLVIAGGAADELFSSILLEVLLLYCVVGSYTSRENWLVWAGFAGLFGGLLAYEYDSYKIVFMLPPAFWLMQALTTSDLERRRHTLQAGGSYICVFAVVALPVIATVINDPGASPFLDGFNRNWVERTAVSPDVTSYLQRSAGFAWGYIQSLIGQIDSHSSSHYRPPGESMVPAIVGTLFALCWLYALQRPPSLFVRIVALVAIVMVLSTSLLANNANVGRLTPVLPLLILLTGVGVDALLRHCQSGDVPRLLRQVPYYAVALTALIVVGNIAAAVKTSYSEPVLREYANNQYSICRSIAAEPRGYQVVQVYAPSQCNLGDDLWLYPDITASVENITHLPSESYIAASSLVIIGDSNGLPEDRISEFVNLASRMHSTHTLRTSETLLGDVVAVSFCYECSSPLG